MFYPAAAFMMPVGARSMDIDRADCLLAALMDPYGVTTAVTDRVLFAPGTDVKAKHYSGPESSRLTEIESAAQQTREQVSLVEDLLLADLRQHAYMQLNNAPRGQTSSTIRAYAHHVGVSSLRRFRIWYW